MSTQIVIFLAERVLFVANIRPLLLESLPKEIVILFWNLPDVESLRHQTHF